MRLEPSAAGWAPGLASQRQAPVEARLPWLYHRLRVLEPPVTLADRVLEPPVSADAMLCVGWLPETRSGWSPALQLAQPLLVREGDVHIAVAKLLTSGNVASEACDDAAVALLLGLLLE